MLAKRKNKFLGGVYIATRKSLNLQGIRVRTRSAECLGAADTKRPKNDPAAVTFVLNLSYTRGNRNSKWKGPASTLGQQQQATKRCRANECAAVVDAKSRAFICTCARNTWVGRDRVL